MSKLIEPASNRRLAKRLIIGLIVIAALVLAYQWLREKGTDVTGVFGSTDTTGFIAALKETESGSQAVILKPDGEVVLSPGYTDGSTDRDLAWPSDGGFLYFVSDRDKGESHIFRWSIGKGAAERRSIDKRSKTSPWFPPASFSDPNRTALVVAGGKVLEFTPFDGSARQMLPPVNKNAGSAGGDEGAQSQFDAAYSQLGTSFKSAKWGKNRQFIAAVMRRESGGELLIVQDMESGKAPLSVAAGDQIDFDVNPTSGEVVFSVEGFTFANPADAPPEYINGGKLAIPFRHMVGIMDPATRQLQPPIALGKTDQGAFSEARLSPDGSKVLLVAGTYLGEGRIRPQGLVVMPAKSGGLAETKILVKAEVHEPSWTPDGKILYVKKNAAGERAIFEIGAEGTGERMVTSGKGNFSSPLASPRTTK